MRLFIAVAIDGKNKKLIHAIQEKYKGSSYGGNFTRKENYHVTLRFLGETEREILPAVRFAMDRAVTGHGPFLFSAGRPGCFSRREGLILYLGIHDGAENLWKLSASINDELLKAGFPADKDIFTPHITLGRKVRLRKDFSLINDEIDVPDIAVTADAITLMESVREKGVLCYKPVYSSKLRL